ncbi:neuronal tyrosine-phosphorylated phosphoinositide-3-kinase adapter 2 [Electrophorus electricus]|uniref:neuronal tyrosine-phosphorylated phosphoinositide-3-kinase adapter 2 n=1 Tax=Electrophorus electricus TaxID=8005 RepID=UPI0015D0CF5A|nr:neuronal tyrosine-phosphorylated phosphoinositide-3-kinase adapter 2 [Electrophorus electricus]
MMSSNEEETLRFFQFVEDSSLRAYNSLVTQNLDHVWNEKSRTSVQEKNEKKRKQEEAIKRTSEEVSAEGKHLRMGSVSMLALPERIPSQQAQLSCGCPRAVRSQSLHSMGGGEDEGSPTFRKQPPPKPRRDPNTKLSISSEAVDFSTTSCKGGDSDRCDAMLGCSEDCKRVPPPKPKRNPSTQLSTSFDETYVHNSTSKGSPTTVHSREAKAPSPSSPTQLQSLQQVSDVEEPVYIEMSGSGRREPPPLIEDEEPGEAVYEEMKYPILDDFDSRWDLSSCRSQTATPCLSDTDIHSSLSHCSTPRCMPMCDIPAPFPNLLTHRPPLLIFPPAPAQCSPNSDESPLTPLDVAKLPMLENAPYGKSPTSSSQEPLSSASTSHLRRAERELTSTPTITASGRSSAPPLPCALYRSSGSSHGYQRSHSACPSPVSMGRCLTPLSLMRAPPFDGPFPGASLPRSASATSHAKGSPPQEGGPSGRLYGSAQNAPAGRSRTPTSPLDELTNLFTTGRNMLKKNSSSRKSKDAGESESKGRGHSSESKREHKERSHHGKESKRDKERSSNGKSLHRRESKDREINGTEALLRRDSKERGCGSTEPLSRRDSYGAPELLSKQNGKDRGSSTTGPASRHDSKDRVCNGVEPLSRRNSRDRSCNGSDLLPRQDGKDPSRNGLERHDSRDRSSHAPEPLTRHDSTKDPGKTGLECRHNSKEGGRNGLDSRQAGNYDTADCGRDCKERSSNGADVVNRRDCKDKGAYMTEALTWHESKDKNTYSSESPIAHERETRPGLLPSISNWSGRSPVSPTLTTGNHELKTVTKVGRSPSTPIEPSPLGTPQRQHQEAQEMPLMPWVCGDSTMLEMIERKQRLCREIRSRQRLLERSPCKTDTLLVLPGWKKANGAKKNGPPPYPTQATIFWDTAI